MDRRNYGSMAATAAVEEDDADPDTEEEEAAGFRACPRLGRGGLAWRAWRGGGASRWVWGGAADFWEDAVARAIAPLGRFLAPIAPVSLRVI